MVGGKKIESTAIKEDSGAVVESFAEATGPVLNEDFSLSFFDDFGLENGRPIFREFFPVFLGLGVAFGVSGAALRHPWRASSL
jgi:hypothetical protein